jgi:hypothetical protein
MHMHSVMDPKKCRGAESSAKETTKGKKRLLEWDVFRQTKYVGSDFVSFFPAHLAQEVICNLLIVSSCC